EARRSADASEKSAAVAHDALTQLERPYIFIFGAKQIFEAEDSKDFYTTYTVANYGKLPAIIEGAWIDWVISDKAEPPSPPLLEDGHTLMTAPIFGAGEKRESLKGYIPQGMSTGEIVARIDNTPSKTVAVAPVFDVPEGFDVYFRAVIKYRGPF